MSHYAAPVDVVNAALSRVGIKRVQSLSESSTTAATAVDIYEPLARARLSEFGLTFCTEVGHLTYDGEATDDVYLFKYQRPTPSTDILRQRVIYDDVNRPASPTSTQWWRAPEVPHALRAGAVVTNIKSDYLKILYATRATEGLWDDWFAEAFVHDLMGEFASAILHDDAKSRLHKTAAEAAFRKARAADEAQQTEKPRREGRYARSWRIGRGYPYA